MDLSHLPKSRLVILTHLVFLMLCCNSESIECPYMLAIWSISPAAVKIVESGEFLKCNSSGYPVACLFIMFQRQDEMSHLSKGCQVVRYAHGAIDQTVLPETLRTANGSEELMFVLVLSFPTPHLPLQLLSNLPGTSPPAKIPQAFSSTINSHFSDSRNIPSVYHSLGKM